MDRNDTRRLLDQITDEGVFEELATAVLREQDPRCRRLAHVGVNPRGRTVKSPLDGVEYISDQGSPRLMAIHHTTCDRSALRRKWLADPDGDLPKTLEVFHRQKDRIPELRLTLILTTNKEPPEELIHDVQATALRAGIEVEIHAGSVIAHFLDTEPVGQALRRKYLGAVQTQLSEDLLRELSVKSLDEGSLDAASWVERDLHEQLAGNSQEPVSFVVGESGMGKTVACLMHLEDHIEVGGFGLLVTAEVLGGSRTLEDAVDATLRELYPQLAEGAGRNAVSYASATLPFLVVVDDVNKSRWPARLLEKLVGWSQTVQNAKGPVRWRLLCPVWPRTVALLSDQAYKVVSKSSIWLGPFSEEEGIAAVQQRRTGPLPMLRAKEVADALGYDPLLIALHADEDSRPEPTVVIRSFVERSLGRLSAEGRTYTLGEYRRTLRSLALNMLERKQLEPAFADVVERMAEQSVPEQSLREIVMSREVVRLRESGDKEHIMFRHDRVRDHLLADAVAHALSRGQLSLPVMSDPYFAEVIGTALAEGRATTAIIDQVAAVNPLALFAAMRHFRQPKTATQRHVIDCARTWIDSGAPKHPRNGFLRHAVLRALSECEGPDVWPLSAAVDEGGTDWWALRARFRNGDVTAGIRLCGRIEPGIRMVGHVELIDHVLDKTRARVVQALDTTLRKRGLGGMERRGALRLGGFVGSPSLSEALQKCWRIDEARHESLADYLWACAHCCGEQPAELLDPIFDEWAALPEEDDDGGGRARISVGADHVRWAFRDRVPHGAIGYFLEQTARPGLRWPLLVMLNGIDHPDAVEFVVRELARQDIEHGVSTFAMTARDEWRLRPRFGGEPMKAASRQRLRELWSCGDSGRHLRRRALEFWCANMATGDLAVLEAVDTRSEIGKVALFERLRRGDETAIPDLLEKLESDGARYWWQAGRYVWTAELTEHLDRALGRLASGAPNPESDLANDLWILPELLTRLPSTTAEQLIKKHWAGLRHSARYVQVALFIASSDLLSAVREVVAHCEDPRSLFAHTASTFGIRVEGRHGITRLSQMEALLPYLDYLSDLDIDSLWEACNENGWFDWRREHLDSRAKLAGVPFVDAGAVAKELDNALAYEDPVFRLHYLGEKVLKAGVPLDALMGQVKDWLERHDEEKALHIAVDLVVGFGRRRHLALLQSHQSAKSRRGSAIIDGASFALRLRSLG